MHDEVKSGAVALTKHNVEIEKVCSCLVSLIVQLQQEVSNAVIVQETRAIEVLFRNIVEKKAANGHTRWNGGTKFETNEAGNYYFIQYLK